MLTRPGFTGRTLIGVRYIFHIMRPYTDVHVEQQQDDGLYFPIFIRWVLMHRSQVKLTFTQPG